MIRTAEFSSCETYRYQLTRSGWPTSGNAEGRKLVWVMLNPSTADGLVEDPTIRRVVEFTQREGYPEAVVVNLYAVRATDPKTLRTHPDPVGPLNDSTLSALAEDATEIVCAWGALGSHYRRASEVLAGPLRRRQLWCLGKTKKGDHPRHPLYVRADQPLEVYRYGPDAAPYLAANPKGSRFGNPDRPGPPGRRQPA